MREDCTRCGSSFEWLFKHGCPFEQKTIWCLLHGIIPAVYAGDDGNGPVTEAELRAAEDL
jgi:hypothetical protein